MDFLNVEVTSLVQLCRIIKVTIFATCIQFYLTMLNYHFKSHNIAYHEIIATYHL